MIWLWIVHTMGVDFTAGYGHWVWYNFWSGFVSDIGEITLFAAIIGMFRKHNCHVKGCWRIGKHPLEGTPYIVCGKHHPDIPNKAPSHEEMLDIYSGGNNAGQITGTINQET